MKLYSNPISGNAYKARLLIGFLNLPCEEVEIDLLQDQQHSPEFLAVNPRGEVPALVDGEVTLCDSAAILLYLASRQGTTPWWSADAVEQAHITEWLAFAASWVQYGVFTARAMVAFGISGNGLPPGFEGDSLEAAQLRGRRSLDILNNHLRDNDWLACGRPTIADIAVFPYVALAPMGNIALTDYPEVTAWIERFKQLDGFQPIMGME